MKSKIKQITLLDGKQLFYPSEEEFIKVHDNVESVVIEQLMTRDEYKAYKFEMYLEESLK